MTWIIPNNKLSAFVPDMGESSLDLNQQAFHLGQSLMWRSKHSPSATWLQRLKREKWLQHLSTQILKPSLTNAFEERWMESLEDTRASLSAQQESDSEPRMNAISGHTLQGEFNFADPDGASLKTSKDTSRWDSPQLLATWKNWVTEQRGDYSQRLKSVHRTNGSGSTSWQTATVSAGAHNQKDGSRIPKLDTQVKQWPTPAARDPAGISGAGRQKRKGNPLDTLPNAVILGPADPDNPSTTGNRQGSAEQWATPRAGNPGSRPNGKGGKILAEQAKNANWATPQARDNKGAQGRSYSGEAKDLPMQTEGIRSQSAGKLNPRWVETLMGLPIGWVSPEPVTHTTCTNRTDELRMLGNGVVPQTAAKAFITLSERLS